MSLHHSLTRGITGSGDWGTNPLKVIGLSRDVLRLHLSDDELMRLCQRMAATLLAARHPDKMDPGDDEARAQAAKYSEAVRILGDPQLFRHALQEFRDTEPNELARLAGLEERVKELLRANEELTGSLQGAQAQGKELAANVERARAFVQASVLHPWSSARVKKTERGTSGEFRVMRREDVSEMYVLTFTAVETRTGLQQVNAEALCDEAANSALIHPCIMGGGSNRDPGNEFIYRGAPPRVAKRRRDTQLRQGYFTGQGPVSLPIPDAPTDLDEEYKDLLKTFASVVKGRMFGLFGVAVNHLKVERGRILRTYSPGADHSGDEPVDVIIGSISPYDLARVRPVTYQGGQLISYVNVLAHVDPFVTRGMALVTVEPSGSLMQNSAGYATGVDAREVLFRPRDFRVRHLVIAMR